ncbi:MAG TPA: helix-turn-helix domain-containing protein [Clostridia bacterium]|nr:helix-turn-helix domain-containing protein [Clostridia bacterium]
MHKLYRGQDEYGRREVAEYRYIDTNFPLKIGRVVYLRKCIPLGTEIHKDAFEITYMTKGKQIYEVEGRKHTVYAGEVFITLPDEEHSTGGEPFDKSEFFYMIVELKNFPEYFLSPTKDERKTLLETCLETFKKNRIIHLGFEAHHYFNTILETFESDSPFKMTIVRNALTDLLIMMIDRSNIRKDTKDTFLTPVLEYIDKNFESYIDMQYLADMAGVSKSRFQKKFKEYTGFPPREYIMRKKVERARELLDNTDFSVTDIAFMLDFSSSQYFSTVFKQYTNVTPAEYKNSKK